MSLQFEWDPTKARTNARNHGVTFDEALTVFGDAFSLTIPDPGALVFERRFAQIGLSSHGRLLVVIHVDRGDTIRLISARPATRAERKSYEEGT